MNAVMIIFAVIGACAVFAGGLVIAAILYDDWYWKNKDRKTKEEADV